MGQLDRFWPLHIKLCLVIKSLWSQTSESCKGCNINNGAPGPRLLIGFLSPDCWVAAGPGVGVLCEETGEENPERRRHRERTGGHTYCHNKNLYYVPKKTCESVLASFDRHLNNRIETLLRFLDESALWSVCWHLPRPQTRVCLVRAAHSIQTRGGDFLWQSASCLLGPVNINTDWGPL